jgi:predicted nucleic acid-binding protein
MTKTYVLDSSAALDFLDAGSGAHRVREVIRECVRQHSPLLMSVVNWGEVYYTLWQKRGEDVAQKAIENLSRLFIQPVPVDFAQSVEAGRMKVRYKMSYVDCLVAALAAQREAVLITGYRDFEKLGRQAKIIWTTRP